MGITGAGYVVGRVYKRGCLWGQGLNGDRARGSHKDPDMRVHGTTPRARSAVHTSLIHAGVKPLYAEPGRTRGTTAHESCTPKLDGKFSGLSYESRPYPGRPPPPTPFATRRISSPPSPPLSSPCPAHYSIHHSSTLSRVLAIYLSGSKVRPGSRRK